MVERHRLLLLIAILMVVAMSATGMLTALAYRSWHRASTICRHAWTATETCASFVEAPRCGVTTTLSIVSSGLSSGGSFSNTSSAAPARFPPSSMRVSAFSSTTSPRAATAPRRC